MNFYGKITKHVILAHSPDLKTPKQPANFVDFYPKTIDSTGVQGGTTSTFQLIAGQYVNSGPEVYPYGG